MVAPPDDRASGEREQRDDPPGGRAVPRGRRPARLPPRVGLAGGDHDSYTRSSGTATTLAPPPSKVQAQIMPGRLVMVWPRWTGA